MDTIEELTEFEDLIDAAHVQRRVEDWVRRIAAVYDDIRNWLPDGWTAQLPAGARSGDGAIARLGKFAVDGACIIPTMPDCLALHLKIMSSLFSINVKAGAVLMPKPCRTTGFATGLHMANWNLLELMSANS